MQREEELNCITLGIDQQLPVCRVCYQSKQPILTLPCLCLSDNSQIHWQCLQKVQQFKNNKQCDVCKSTFTTEDIYTDQKRQTSCYCECLMREFHICSFSMLALKMVLFVAGFMLGLTPVYIKMEIVYTYLCIGVGGLLIFFSFLIEKPNMDHVKQFLLQIKSGFICTGRQWGSRHCDVSYLWCLRFLTRIPTKCTGIRLICNNREAEIRF